MTSPDPRHDALVEALLAAARGADMAELGVGGTPEEQALLRARWQQARALVALRRVPPPAALDGFVVAALQAGAREARAVAAVRDLALAGPLTAPSALEGRVAASIDRLRAPRELDALVAQRVAAPEVGVARSMLGRLPRLDAPDDLGERLAASGGVGARRARPFDALQRALLVAGAALLSFVLVERSIGDRVGDGGHGPRSDWRQPVAHRPTSVRSIDGVEPPRERVALTFEFVGHESLSTVPLSPRLRALASGLASGLVGEPMGGGS